MVSENEEIIKEVYLNMKITIYKLNFNNCYISYSYHFTFTRL